MDERVAATLRQEQEELQVQLNRKRAEVSNLTVGFTRAEEGVGAIPPEPLKANLIAARAELSHLEQKMADLEFQLLEAQA